MANHWYKNMKKNILTNTKKFFHNKRGAVSLEFLFMLILLVFIFAFLLFVRPKGNWTMPHTHWSMFFVNVINYTMIMGANH